MRNILLATFVLFAIPAMADDIVPVAPPSVMPMSPGPALPVPSANPPSQTSTAIPTTDPVVTLHMAIQQPTNGLFLSMENESSKPSSHMDMAMTPDNAKKLRDWLEARYPETRPSCSFMGYMNSECWSK